MTVVGGDPKVSFSLAIKPRSWEDATPLPGLFHFTIDPYLIMLIVKQGGIKYHFCLWYIYIYIQTDCFVVSQLSSVWQKTRYSQNCDQKPALFYASRRFYRTATIKLE